MPQYDVITLGETMIRLTPPNLKRIEQTTTFDIEIGGSESNMAVGLARLGLKVLWLSRLTNNALGRLLAQTIGRYGVDTSRVIWTDEDRVGLYFLEEGKPPRSSRLIYDRRDSALSRIKPSDLPVNLFRPETARLLHLTGITLALSQNAATTARRALNLAKEAGWLVSFDLNYRRQLWTAEAALAGCAPFMQAADILLAPLNDVCILFGLAAETTLPEQALNLLAERFPQATIVLTMGEAGALGRQPGYEPVHQPVFPAKEVGRLGGGDAFAAGFLYGYLTAANTADQLLPALRWGAATAALKYTIPGDIPVIERAEVELLVNQGSAGSKLNR